MAWHYFRDGTTQGPVDLPELQRLHREGVVEGSTPVWTDGMADWTPYQMTPAAGGAGPAPGGTLTATQVCAECGKSFPEDEMLSYEGKWVCVACKPLFFQRLKEGVAAIGTLRYTTVTRRFCAVFIDGLLLEIVILLPVILIAGMGGLTAAGRSSISPAFNLVFTLVAYLLPALYEILMIGRYGATLGKMAMKIKVVTPDGGPISYGRSTGRYFAKMLSGIIFGIGYLMAIWDDQKRALHDRICKTRVISADAS
jgi:uncharacterized RDD family membrane protein YckC